MMLSRLLFAFFFSFLLSNAAIAQQPDSIQYIKDSSSVVDSTAFTGDSINIQNGSYNSFNRQVEPAMANNPGIEKILDDNIFLNSKGKPFIFVQRLRKENSKDALFYTIAMIVLMFAILRFSYPRYFSNLFRVFLNTSLRQSQLTDQLLQAKLPSLLYNIFFILSGGGYIYLLLNNSGKTIGYSSWQLLLICATSLLTIYFVKYCILKFTGWITGFKQEADTYIFIIFLINKILAIGLMPLIIIIAFSDKALVETAMLVSYIMISLMLLMRFFRSYSLLQNRLKVSGFHFMIYILGIEVIPLLVIYRLAVIFISKNL